MSTPIHLLCFSKDPLLLQTRQAILARHYAVTAVSTLEALVALPPVPAFQVAVFCHTLERDECRPAAEFFRKRWPGGRIIALTAEGTACIPVSPDYVLPGIAGPLALLTTLRLLLTTPQLQRWNREPPFGSPRSHADPAHL